MQYNFEWDFRKARSNLKKHGISFEQAAEVFLDPDALTAFDRDHSEIEERWITLGKVSLGNLCLVVIHNFHQQDNETAAVRVISARQATKREIKSYEANHEI